MGRQDSNLGMAVPKTAALPLGDAPMTKHFQAKWIHLATRKMRPTKLQSIFKPSGYTWRLGKCVQTIPQFPSVAQKREGRGLITLKGWRREAPLPNTTRRGAKRPLPLLPPPHWETPQSRWRLNRSCAPKGSPGFGKLPPEPQQLRGKG